MENDTTAPLEGILSAALNDTARAAKLTNDAVVQSLKVVNDSPEAAERFVADLHPALRADYVLANPPFNDSDWFRKDDDVRWQYGVPPRGNANFALSSLRHSAFRLRTLNRLVQSREFSEMLKKTLNADHDRQRKG